MNRKKIVTFLFVFSMLFVFSGLCSALEVSAGYSLAFTLHELPASEIDHAFNDLPGGGHSSFFFFEIPVTGILYASMSPGAMNYESGEGQLHVQYNLLSMGIKTETSIFPVAGGGLGGCILTLTDGSGSSGETVSGYYLKNSVFIWTAYAGAGYRFESGIEIILEGRGFGFFDPALLHLNSMNVGTRLTVPLGGK